MNNLVKSKNLLSFEDSLFEFKKCLYSFELFLSQDFQDKDVIVDSKVIFSLFDDFLVSFRDIYEDFVLVNRDLF